MTVEWNIEIVYPWSSLSWISFCMEESEVICLAIMKPEACGDLLEAAAACKQGINMQDLLNTYRCKIQQKYKYYCTFQWQLTSWATIYTHFWCISYYKVIICHLIISEIILVYYSYKNYMHITSFTYYTHQYLLIFFPIRKNIGTNIVKNMKFIDEIQSNMQ